MRYISRRFQVFWHWQNLSAESRPGAFPWVGRAWLHRSDTWRLSLAWAFRWRPKLGVGVSTSEQGATTTLYIAPILGSFFITVTSPKWLQRILPQIHYTLRNGESGTYPDDREIEVSVHGGQLWWSLWCHPMEWHSGTPKWRSGNFDPVRFVFGRRRYTSVEGPRMPVLVPMTEGSYEATVTRCDKTWSRTRLPFARRRTDYWIEIPKGIPFEGKGESGYDCGTDRLYGCGGRSVEDAIAQAVRRVLEKRRQYGTPREVPAPAMAA